MRRTILLAIGVVLMTTAGLSHADRGRQDQTPRGVLDRPMPQLPQQAASQAQRQQALLQLRAEARAERRQLRQLNENQLRNRARQADRLAQLVLAESLADEAQQWADVPQVANDALSEALEWYSIAARRGFPGSVAIDKVVPAFPVKVFRP